MDIISDFSFKMSHGKKNSFSVLVFFLCLFSIWSCGKRNRSDKSGYISGASNAVPVNSQMTDNANTQSLAQGVSIGIVDITQATPQPGVAQLKTLMRISDQGQAVDLPIYTSHYNPGDVTGTLQVLGLSLQITARCPNVYCNPYYIMVNVYRGGTAVVQEGFKKFFDGSQMDRFLLVPPDQWLDFNKMTQTL